MTSRLVTIDANEAAESAEGAALNSRGRKAVDHSGK
jgi:hypothetical protein